MLEKRTVKSRRKASELRPHNGSCHTASIIIYEVCSASDSAK